jgi:hypothetical protein
MRISRPTIAFAIVLFTSAIGADKCGAYWPGVGGEPPPPPQNTKKPFCMTDPGAGCLVKCTDVNIATFSDQCAAALPGGPGPLAQKFIDDVRTEEQNLMDQGKTFCMPGRDHPAAGRV